MRLGRTGRSVRMLGPSASVGLDQSLYSDYPHSDEGQYCVPRTVRSREADKTKNVNRLADNSRISRGLMFPPLLFRILGGGIPNRHHQNLLSLLVNQ